MFYCLLLSYLILLIDFQLISLHTEGVFQGLFYFVSLLQRIFLLIDILYLHRFILWVSQVTRNMNILSLIGFYCI